MKPIAPAKADNGDSVAAIYPDDEAAKRVITLIEEKAFMERLAAPATGKMLRAYGRRLTGNRHDAEDLAQNTMLRAIEAFKRGAYVERGLFDYWLIRVASNQLRATKRKSSNRNEQAHSPDELPDIPIAPSQEDAVFLRQIAHAASTALSREFQAVFWTMAQGVKWDEAATELDLPSGTVKSRTHRARATLRKALGD
jgi:RNA polymerase sigma-70 factor, ECF subfamily